MYDHLHYEEHGVSPSGYIPKPRYPAGAVCWDLQVREHEIVLVPKKLPWQAVLGTLGFTLLIVTVLLLLGWFAGRAAAIIAVPPLMIGWGGVVLATWGAQVTACQDKLAASIDRDTHAAVRKGPNADRCNHQIESIELARFNVSNLSPYNRFSVGVKDLLLVYSADDSPRHFLLGRQMVSARRIGRRIAVELNVPFVESRI